MKDSINDAIILNRIELVNPEKIGTKAAAHYQFTIAPNEMRTIRLRLRKIDDHPSPGDSVVSLSQIHSSALTGASRPSLPTGERVRATIFDDFDEIFVTRKAEADEFYNAIAPANLTSEHKTIQRQALSGLLWTKQFYYYIVEEWLEGDPASPPSASLALEWSQFRMAPSLQRARHVDAR